MTHAHSSSEGLWTRTQLSMLLKAWGFPGDARVPGKNQKLVLVFPATFDLRVGVVTQHARRSTDGKMLYRVELTNDNKHIAAYSGV